MWCGQRGQTRHSVNLLGSAVLLAVRTGSGLHWESSSVNMHNNTVAQAQSDAYWNHVQKHLL